MPLSRVAGVTDGNGVKMVYGYDKLDHVVSIAKADGTGLAAYTYDETGNRTIARYAGATFTNSYERRLLTRVTRNAGSVTQVATYHYDRPDGTDTGQVQSRTDVTGTADNTYDGFGRLTKAGSRTYGYDNAGNITAGDGHTYTVDNADQMTKIDNVTVGYDGAGNLTTTDPGGQAHYSDTNQRTSVTSSSGTLFTAGYDTLDQTQPASITERVGSGDVTHVFTRTALGISRTVDNGAATTYAHDVDGKLTGLVDAAGKHHNAITDYQGSVIALIDDTGAVTGTYGYTPYGFNTGITGPAGTSNRLRWIGSYQLAGSEYLTGYRHYSPVYARFTQPDPTGQEANTYAYGQGDPVNRTDLAGAASAGCVNAGAGAIFTLLGTAATWAATGATGGITAGLAVGSTFAAVGAVGGAVLACRNG
ncbi:RHS repeat-associated core domain-containing protein [Amycolatopsis balhimycina]|uniref:RHS repeat-associated core domain-containing protein n=1 Tax=Amycolatopsis balhimycina TaxID=208443 RepID=UPI00036759C7|nr:RHS repeat-associated core domain-containing protein [Amycolatopsis balhimycina]